MESCDGPHEILDIYNTQHTCTHMVWHNLGLGGIPTLPGPDPAKPLIRWKNPNVFVYPLSGVKTGVGQCNFYLGCVREVNEPTRSLYKENKQSKHIKTKQIEGG